MRLFLALSLLAQYGGGGGSSSGHHYSGTYWLVVGVGALVVLGVIGWAIGRSRSHASKSPREDSYSRR